MLDEQPDLLPGPGRQAEVLLGVLLVVHATSPVNVLGTTLLIVRQHLLVVLPSGRSRWSCSCHSCLSCLGDLLLVILLDRSYGLLRLGVAVVDQLRQKLEELVIPRAAGELKQDLAVLLVLQRHVKEVHDGHAQLVLVTVRQVIVAHDRFLDGDEDMNKARNEMLNKRWLVQLLRPGGECQAEAVQELHRPSAQRRVLDVVIRRHDDAKRRHHWVWIDVRKKAGGNAVTTLLSVAVSVNVA
mmetsp:Transcript_69976/g.112908  ORF Transcript_69976/g.112908 Transcript_69976/m.112908 type:complete len:241 (-) Transcript_69976:303-1025(-)